MCSVSYRNTYVEQIKVTDMRLIKNIDEVREFLKSLLVNNVYYFREPIEFMKGGQSFSAVSIKRNSERGRVRLFDVTNTPHEIAHISPTSLIHSLNDYITKVLNHIEYEEEVERFKNRIRTILQGRSPEYYVRGLKTDHKTDGINTIKLVTSVNWKRTSSKEKISRYWRALRTLQSFKRSIALYKPFLDHEADISSESNRDKASYYAFLCAYKGNRKYEVISDAWMKADHLLSKIPAVEADTALCDIRCLKEVTNTFAIMQGSSLAKTLNELVLKGYKIIPTESSTYIIIEFPHEEILKVNKERI